METEEWPLPQQRPLLWLQPVHLSLALHEPLQWLLSRPRRATSLTKSFIAGSAGATSGRRSCEQAASHQTPQLGHELGRFLLTQRAGKVQLCPPRVHLHCWRRCTNSGGAPTCICKQRNGWCTMQRNLFSYELSKKTLRIGRYNTSDS